METAIVVGMVMLLMLAVAAWAVIVHSVITMVRDATQPPTDPIGPEARRGRPKL